MTNHYQSLILSLAQQATDQEWLEFKHNFHSPDEIGKRISALANGACLAGKKFGYLVFGIEDGMTPAVNPVYINLGDFDYAA